MIEKLPNHLAIILDGNGRWAKRRGLPRTMGHKVGSDRFRDLSLAIFHLGIPYLSAFIFSTENFKRDKEEVDYLMDLFVDKFKKEAKLYQKEEIRVIFSGRRDGLREDVLHAMDEITEMTKDNRRGTLNFCLNYGGQYEIVDMIKQFMKENIDPDTLTPELLFHYTYQNLPPIDLLIRTSGEYRLSNFMLYQSAYAELYFTDTYFPDFDESYLEKALLEYQNRDRRFGGAK